MHLQAGRHWQQWSHQIGEYPCFAPIFVAGPDQSRSQDHLNYQRMLIVMLAPPAAEQHAAPDFCALPAGVAATVLTEYRLGFAGVELQGQVHELDDQMMNSSLLRETAALPATWSRTLVHN